MKLLIRVDDLGFSEAVNLRLEKALSGELVGNVGIMTNMPAASHGYQLVKDYKLCLGVHVNISAGRPLSNAKDIPSLVNEAGLFHQSFVYRNSSEDIVRLEDIETECEMQYRKFVEITGRSPDYIDIHAIRAITLPMVFPILRRSTILCLVVFPIPTNLYM